jgi:hypothetical protein
MGASHAAGNPLEKHGTCTCILSKVSSVGWNGVGEMTEGT